MLSKTPIRNGPVRFVYVRLLEQPASECCLSNADWAAFAGRSERFLRFFLGDLKRVTAQTERSYAGEGVVGRGGGNSAVFGATSALKAQSKAIIHPIRDHPKKRLTRKMKAA